ncbi:MAG: DNA polymerase Y family protein [Bacteroidetes bacterium]|nr:DNA polymerase Y family protein [Bacteroidota bacterium]
MSGRFLSLWFRHLTTDFTIIRRPALRNKPFVLAAPDHGRMVITSVSPAAGVEGVSVGLPVADARVLIPGLEVLDDPAGLDGKLLRMLALWCIRYTPVVGIDLPDGLVMDISGCAHLWGGEKAYLTQILHTLRGKGYDVRGAVADTVGAAWAVARYGRTKALVEPDGHSDALLSLPPAALRIDPLVTSRLHRLGLDRIHRIAGMPRQSLRTRFGNELLLRLDQAFGRVEELIEPVVPTEVYIERLPCLEPICTATGIGIALTRLLETLCQRLQQEGKGLRTALFKGYRVDGRIVEASIGTHRASHHVAHLLRLFEEKMSSLEPDLGIEVFTLEAPKVEDVAPLQPAMWNGATGLQDNGLVELVDRITNKTGTRTIHRYLPAQHYWPERAMAATTSLDEIAVEAWSMARPRPIHILARPEVIEVTAPIPDYPPMLFIHKGQRHSITRAEGPERIEQEWWLSNGEHRDYYSVEDDQGVRFWIFRSGHYAGLKSYQWFLHGYFA